MMTKDECIKTIKWLEDVILRLEDRPDHEAFQEHINRLKTSANELQERLSDHELLQEHFNRLNASANELPALEKANDKTSPR